ncbi:monovalent cation:proton antiporter-2 (CPA2) family protein [Priestia endophytica]|uniref:cation:proton antiporter n=1 Tax=Priestia endophytica TaxID=135735 RepID=UPI003D2A70DA
MTFILSLALILLLTKFSGHLSVRLGQPAVLGKLIVGILLGPAALDWIRNDQFIYYFSEIGVLLLMFIAGLETNLHQLKSNWKPILMVAILGILFPFIGGVGLGELFNLDRTSSLFMGVLLCVTSVSITVQVLKDLNKLNSKEGNIILGAAVIDAIIVVVLLAILISLFGTDKDISLTDLIVKKIMFFIVIILVGWFIVPKILNVMMKLKVSEPLLSTGLAICFSYVYFANLMGMSGIIGAFAAGLAISQTNHKDIIVSKVEPVAYSIFVPVFFVSIGLNISFKNMDNHLIFIATFSLVAILTKLISGVWGSRLSGLPTKSSLLIGSGMISKGGVGLVIASAGLQNSLLTPDYFTPTIIIVVITTLISPPLTKYIIQFESKMNRKNSVLKIYKNNVLGKEKKAK